MEQQEWLQVPHHPFRMQTRSPYSEERHFLTANAYKNFLFWGGRATENNKTCLTIPSWSKKSPGRVPRPVKVKKPDSTGKG